MTRRLDFIARGTGKQNHETSRSRGLPRIGSMLAISVAIGGSLAAVALAAENHRISQKNRAFNLNSLIVEKDEIVKFFNDDEFIHQVYVKSGTFNVDTEESSPGDTISVPFTVAGTFEVHCHIHPKMQLIVTVK